MKARLHLSAVALSIACFLVPVRGAIAGESVFAKVIESISGRLHRHVVKAAGLGEISETDEEPEAGHRVMLEEFLQSVFLKKQDAWFTQRKRDSAAIPYQLSGLEVRGPHGNLVTEADKLNGIDRRVTYSFGVDAHRSYDETEGWGEWRNGKPPLLTGVTLARKNGVWVIENSPRKYFSL